MSASETVNSRRRPVTYGRTFRRPRPESDSTTVHHLVHPKSKAWGLQALERVGPRDYDTLSRSPPLANDNTDNKKEGIKATGESRYTLSMSQQQNCLHKAHAMLSNEEPVCFTKNQSTIYDVPSSCEEIDVTKKPLRRKRRKIEMTIDDPGNPSIGVREWPQKSLKDQARTSRNHQKALAAYTVVDGEQVCDRQLKDKRCYKPSLSTNEHNSSRSLRKTATKSVRRGKDELCHDQQLRASTDRLLLSRNPRKNVVDAKSHVTLQNSAPNKLVRSLEPKNVHYYSIPASPLGNSIEDRCMRDKSYLSPPRTPSSSPQSRHEVLTPRQRELWSKLLVDEHPNSANQTFNITIDTENTGNYTQGNRNGKASEAGAETEKSSTIISTRRRKIVERLRGRQNFDFDPQALVPSEEGNTIVMAERSVSNKFHNKAVGDILLVEDNCVAKRVPVNSTPEGGYPTAPPPRVEGSRLTYARQRSYLTEDSLGAAISLNESIETDVDTRQTSQRYMLTASGPAVYPEIQEEPDDDNKPEGGAIRSIHELREAGGNERLASEMETILDDLDEGTGSQTFKRARLLKLVLNLREIEYRRYFVYQGWEKRLLAHVGTSYDAVTNVFLVAAMLYLIAGSSATPFLDQFCRRPIVSFFLKMLENDTDIDIILKDRKTNLSKVTQPDYFAFSRSLKRSAIWRLRAPEYVTPHICALQCIEYLVHHVRDANTMTELLPQSALDRIVRALDDSSIRSTYFPGMLFRCQLIVSIAENCTTSDSGRSDEQCLTATAVARIAQLLPLVATWPDKQRGNLLPSILRLYLNLTNNNAVLCETFSTQQVLSAICSIVISQFERTSIAAVIPKQELLLDTLILSLGALINIVECSDTARRLIKDLRNEPVSVLDRLLDIFLTKLTDTVNVSDYFHNFYYLRPC